MPTRIAWTDGGESWNPWRGCSEVGPECGIYAPNGTHGFCYAAVEASRDRQRAHVGVAVGGKWTGKITRSSPAHWKKPFKLPAGTMVFTCSMSDFFHPDVPLAWLDEALDVIEQTPHLIYQMLTKRTAIINRRLGDLKRKLPRNVWIGATIGHIISLPLLKPLLQVDATLHFLSCEPLLTALPDLPLTGIDWVIGGGQSGSDAAICDADWMRDLRDQCVRATVPFFLKQWGIWESNPTPMEFELDPEAHGGATLDGRLWREYPAAKTLREV